MRQAHHNRRLTAFLMIVVVVFSVADHSHNQWLVFGVAVLVAALGGLTLRFYDRDKRKSHE